MKDYYKILGVGTKASDDEIKKTFRKLARQYHPDANPDNKVAEERFKEISEAYDTLGDTEKRAQYDAMRANPFAGQGGFNRQAGHGQGGFSGAGFGGFDDILSTLFRQAGTQQGGRMGTKGQDVEVEAEVTLEEAVHGTTLTIGVNQPDGSTKRLRVNIPPGVSTGSKVRAAGEGEHGSGGRGDMLVKVTVRPHARFTREGDDLILEQPVSVFDAVLGGEITVHTLDGDIKLKIPAGTQGGKSFRLKEKGVPHLKGGGRGALLVKVQIQIPAAVSDRDEALWRQLAGR